MAETENNNDLQNEAKPKKKSKLLLIIIAAVILLAGGGGGFYFWNRSVQAKAASAEAAKAEKEEKSHAKKETGGKFALPEDDEVKNVVELQPFIVNLADAEQARYLRMSVSVGLGEEGGGEEKPDNLFMTRVKNAMLSVLSVKKSSDVLTVEGKQKLREELLEAAQAASDKPKVHAIYITDFIVQL
jgi:flagellar FliL protein